MESQFCWTKQWYPISPISYLDPSRPHSVTLLGKNLVIWRDNQQKWTVMDNVCPHKLAQLSMGTIKEDGTLMCRHHGWCFDGEGKCTKIPMLAGSETEEMVCDSQKARVTSYPTQVLQGLLWVWPDNSKTAFEDCNLKHPATTGELDSSSSDWHLSEVPVGYTVSFESSFDPSHAQFLHEGVGAFSPEKAVPMQYFQAVGEISAEGGFTLKHQGYNIFNKDMDATRKFSPPCSNTTTYSLPNGGKMLFQLYFIPTQPGYCRYIGKFSAGGGSVKRNFFWEMIPQYLRTGIQHLSTYKLSDQDLSVMHSQEVNQLGIDKKWQKAYFMASPSDVGIITFRKWLDEFAAGAPSWQENREEGRKELSEEQLYDRWHRHSKYCPSCRSTVDFLEKVRRFSNIGAGVFALLSLVLVLIGIPVQLAVISTVLVVFSLILSYLSDDWRQLFFSSIPRRGLPIVKLYKTK
ncbi:MAG: Rieske 2Fe-2S domain-containing protein [Coleofasciculaceae cyanobacterium]